MASELETDAIGIQAFQWARLGSFFAGLAVLAGGSAIMSAFIAQYVLAIINAIVFFGSFLCFLTAGFRWSPLALFLMIYMAAAFVLNAFYAVALLADFVSCNDSTCAGWRLFLYNANYVFVCFLAAVTFMVAKQCWILLVDERDVTYRILGDPLQKTN